MPDNKQGECRLGQNDQKICILKPIFANKLINKFSLLMFDFEDMFPEATFVKSKKKFSSMVIKFPCHKVSMVIKFKRVASLRHPLIIDQIHHLMICHSLKTGNYCLISREPGNYGLIS